MHLSERNAAFTNKRCLAVLLPAVADWLTDCTYIQGCVDKAFEHLQGVKFMGRRIRLDYANKAKAAGPPSREEVMARQQAQAVAQAQAAKAAAANGGGGGGGGGALPRQNSGGAGSAAQAGGNSGGAAAGGGGGGGGGAGAAAAAAAMAMAAAGDVDDCPLCCEPLDKTDQSFEPCSCGYQVCHDTSQTHTHTRNTTYTT